MSIEGACAAAEISVRRRFWAEFAGNAVIQRGAAIDVWRMGPTCRGANANLLPEPEIARYAAASTGAPPASNSRTASVLGAVCTAARSAAAPPSAATCPAESRSMYQG